MKFSAGSTIFDELLEGGYETAMLNTIYGEAATGKTTACLLAAIACTKRGKKTVFIDTENGFSVERLKQLTSDYKDVLDKTILFTVKSFEEQSKIINNLGQIVKSPQIGLVIIDTISLYYRAARALDLQRANNLLIEQMDIIRNLYKMSNAIFLITCQVYADMEKKNGVKIVGGIIVHNRSKCLIQLSLMNKNNRMVILEKHPELDKKEIPFKIIEEGFTHL